jgi:hypothetical protein
VLATLTGGCLLALTFFIFKERIFKPTNLDGTWVYTQETHMTEYNQFEGMLINYLSLLACEGNNIYGSSEKINDITSSGKKREYIGKYRTLTKITGHIEKRYLSKDRIFIHISEFGEQRESSTVHSLEKINENTLKGSFSSTIANQQGTAVWIRRST